jgi:hypothetical protein
MWFRCAERHKRDAASSTDAETSEHQRHPDSHIGLQPTRGAEGH